MRHLLFILWVLLLTSCGTTYQLSTLNNNDPIYGIVESTGDTIQIDVISNDFQLDRKFRFDNKFRWNYSMYAMNQDYIWHQDFFWRNRMFRNGYGFSSWDFYWNRHDFWWNWSAGYPFNYGFSYWNNWGWHRDPFYYRPGWNYGYGYGFNDWGWRNGMNDYAWEHRDRRNVAYVNGRRGSNIVVTPNGSSRGGTNNIISNPNIRINRGRPNIPNPDDNIDVVIESPTRTRLGRLIEKIENASGVRVRTYENPNNVPNNRIRNYNRPENGNNNVIRNNNNIRNYNRPPVNNNPPSRSYTPPPRSSSPPVISRSSSSGRSSGGVSVSRGSRGNNIN